VLAVQEQGTERRSLPGDRHKFFGRFVAKSLPAIELKI